MKKYKYRKDFTFEGKKYTVRADTLTELGAKMERKINEIRTERKVLSGDITLSEWAERCIDTYKTGQSASTREKYVNRVRSCILSQIGDLPLKKIHPMDVQACLNRQAGKSKTQVNDVFYALHFLFRCAYQNHLIASDPTEGLTKPKTAKIHKRRALTPEERRYFLESGREDRRYYLFLLMLLCGCRPSEAAGCQGRDVVIKKGVPYLHIRGTKTENSDRMVPIPAELYELIADIPPYEHIACTSTGKAMNKDDRRRAWNSLCRNINIKMGCHMYRNQLIPPYPLAPDLVPYCLRHEYCTELARRGIDIRVAQKLMGHSSITLTADIYTNFQSDDLEHAAEVLGAVKTEPEAAPTAISVGK